MISSRILFIIQLCFVFVLVESERVKRGNLVWSERFDEFDTNVWNHLVTAWRGGNDEFQYYRNNRKNSFVKDGVLHIRPTFVADELGEEFLLKGNITAEGCNWDPCSSIGNGHEITAPIFSARIRTLPTFSFKYGRVEIRAKMPRGDWIWPAMWMLPANTSIYGTWPAGGEIDIVEVRSNRNYTDHNKVSQGINRFGSTLHFGPRWPYNRWDLAHWEVELDNGDFSDDFHTFELEWTNTSIAFYLDGDEVGKISPPEGFWKLGEFDKNPGGESPWKNGEKMAPFDQEFFITLNVAVGGKFFPDGWINNPHPRPWSWSSGKPMRQFWEARKFWEGTWDRPEMLVDHILVYSL